MRAVGAGPRRPVGRSLCVHVSTDFQLRPVFSGYKEIEKGTANTRFLSQVESNEQSKLQSKVETDSQIKSGLTAVGGFAELRDWAKKKKQEKLMDVNNRVTAGQGGRRKWKRVEGVSSDGRKPDVGW